MNESAHRRELESLEKRKGLQISDLVLVAVLIAAGAVLKLVIGIIFQGGVKPNFMISAYCLALLLIQPRGIGQGVGYGAIVGLITGAVCQIPLLCGTPFVNFLSELLGGMVIGALAALPHKAGRPDLRATIGTFVATFVSGASFSAIATIIRSMDPMAGLVQFGPIVVITALLNAVIVGVLVIPLRKALRKEPANSKRNEKPVEASDPVEAQPVATPISVEHIESVPIEIDHVSFTYENGLARAIEDIAFTIEPGDFLGIIGESGAGKSTLGHCINGVVPHHYKGDFYGSVRIGGADTFDLALTDISQIIGTVGQDIDSQMVAAVVEDEILYGLENFGVPRDEIGTRLEKALSDTGITGLRDRKISTLSGGQRQKVALATIMALRPKVVLLDEPTAELDPVSSQQMFDLLHDLNEQGVTVIIVEQKVMLLSQYAKHLLVLAHGRAELYGTTEEVLKHTNQMRDLGINCPRVALMSATLNERGIGTGQVAATVDEAIEYVEEVLAS